MTDSTTIVFYDIPAGRPESKAWSPNTWKARYALNIKGLKYRTEWVEYPDIEALYHKLGISAVLKSSDGSPYYTLPIIRDPSTDSIIVESFAIVKYLDKTYPDTYPLAPEGLHALLTAFISGAWNQVQGPIFRLVVSPVNDMLNPRSEEYFRRTREESLGVKLEDVCKEEDWIKAEKALGLVERWLNANGEGKNLLFLGDKICLADLQVAGALKWAEAALGKDSEGWKRICSWHGGKWKAISDKFAQYDHVDV